MTEKNQWKQDDNIHLYKTDDKYNWDGDFHLTLVDVVVDFWSE